LVLLSLSVLLVGCGGGGGGGGGGGSTTGQYTSLGVTGYTTNSQMLDPHDLIPGDVIQLDITGFNSKNVLVVLPVSGWRTNAPSSVATLGSGGLLTAVSASPTTYTIEVTVAGTTYTSGLVVTAQHDLITGLVRNPSDGIGSAIVDFYNAAGHQVGQAYTSRDGTFRASVPSTSTKFTIDMSAADPGNYYYYPQFTYGNEEYLEATTCLTPLPTTLSAINPTPLPNPIVPAERTLGPPDPPTGCVG